MNVRGIVPICQTERIYHTSRKYALTGRAERLPPDQAHRDGSQSRSVCTELCTTLSVNDAIVILNPNETLDHPGVEDYAFGTIARRRMFYILRESPANM